MIKGHKLGTMETQIWSLNFTPMIMIDWAAHELHFLFYSSNEIMNKSIKWVFLDNWPNQCNACLLWQQGIFYKWLYTTDKWKRNWTKSRYFLLQVPIIKVLVWQSLLGLPRPSKSFLLIGWSNLNKHSDWLKIKWQ